MTVIMVFHDDDDDDKEMYVSDQVQLGALANKRTRAARGISNVLLF